MGDEQGRVSILQVDGDFAEQRYEETSFAKTNISSSFSSSCILLWIPPGNFRHIPASGYRIMGLHFRVKYTALGCREFVHKLHNWGSNLPGVPNQLLASVFFLKTDL
jgi:hypothetical protein